jgi:hypothetical protein
MMVKHIGEALVTHDELVKMGEPILLTVVDLSRRVLVKGKVRGAASGSKARHAMQRAASGFLSPRPRETRGNRQISRSSAQRTVSDIFRNSRLRRTVTIRDTMSLEPTTPAGSDQPKAWKPANPVSSSGLSDPFYTSYLSLRSIPAAAFLGVEPPRHPFPISSMSEDKLLIALGLSRGERKQIEGVKTKGGSPTDEFGSEAHQSLRASFRLAMDPPLQVGVMQRRTASWQLRPFPAGARFSGSNSMLQEFKLRLSDSTPAESTRRR